MHNVIISRFRKQINLKFFTKKIINRRVFVNIKKKLYFLY